jgi:hypothetical protein
MCVGLQLKDTHPRRFKMDMKDQFQGSLDAGTKSGGFFVWKQVEYQIYAVLYGKI